MQQKLNSSHRIKNRINILTEALQSHPSKSLFGSRWMKQAAVAIVLRENLSSLELLMIKRAEKEGDPWSGHMAFPGGRVEELDADPFAASLRETREEISLDLTVHAEPIGDLSVLPASAGGRVLPMAIYPYLFWLTGDPTCSPNEEVDEVVWVPFSLFSDAQNRKTMQYKKAGVGWELPCYHYDEKVIWGLSLKMIDELKSRIDSVV